MCRLQLRRTSQPTQLPLQRTQATMQKRISILIITFALAISAGAQIRAIDPFDSRSGQALNRPGSEHDYEHEKRQTYTCLMHPEVVTNHPGNCPKCGMTLVPKEQKKRPTPVNREQASKVQRPTLNHQSHLSHESHSMREHEMRPPSHGSEGMHMEMHSSIYLADPM